MRKDRHAYLSFIFSLPLLRYGLSLLLLFLLNGCSADGREAAALPPPTGHYEGPITYQGAELRASLDLREVAPGQLQGEVRLADRQSLTLPAQQVSYQHPRLTVRWPTGTTTDFTINFTREGDFLKGKFTADSAAADVLLVRRGEAEPLPYRQQPMRFQSSASTLAGTLLIPDDTLQVHPAVVLLQNAPQRPALAVQMLTDLLARRGVVVLTIAGRSGAAGRIPDSLATDVLAAVRALRRMSGVDSARVGLLGAGAEATTLALAARQDDNQEDRLLRFIVALGAPGTSKAAREAERTARVLKQQGTSAADQRLAALTYGQLERYIQREGKGDTTALHRNLRKIAPQPWAALTGLPTHVPARSELEQAKWRELALDPSAQWGQVRVPVLFLYGGADTTLNVQASASQLRRKVGTRRGSVVRVYPGTDQNLLLPAGEQNGKWQWPRPAPGYVEELTAWLSEQIK